jgi:DnaK suppressor protein
MEDLSDEDGVDSHPADSASETLSREIELSLEDNADRLLAAIDAALKRLDGGTYGVCESCEQNISPERLEALPYATKCIDCKRREERG